MLYSFERRPVTIFIRAHIHLSNKSEILLLYRNDIKIFISLSLSLTLGGSATYPQPGTGGGKFNMN